jgi:hypothetical protein
MSPGLPSSISSVTVLFFRAWREAEGPALSFSSGFDMPVPGKVDVLTCRVKVLYTYLTITCWQC